MTVANDFKFWIMDNYEDCVDFYGELKEAAWNVLRDHPGTDMMEWIEYLIEEYPTEVVDTLGTNPPEVYAELTDWWNDWSFDDGILPVDLTYMQWAECFATERAVEVYDMLVEAKAEIERLKGIKIVGR